MANPNPIDWTSHEQFVKSLYRNEDKCYYCVLYKNVFIGSVNIQYLDSITIERGIYVHPDYWGRGFAKTISKELYSYLHGKGVMHVRTKVLKFNNASIALQNSLGAVPYKEDKDYVYFELDL